MLLGNQLGIAPGDLAASTSPVNAQQGIADGNNWAVGGYRTDQIYDSITAANGSLIERDNTPPAQPRWLPGGPCPPGPVPIRTRCTHITGGGNDFLQGRILNDVQAQQAAGRLVDSVQALQQAARHRGLADLARTSGASTSGIRRLASCPIPAAASAAPGFGLAADQNLIGTCFQRQRLHHEPTYGINGSTPDPSKLLFNDSVHPTSPASA